MSKTEVISLEKLINSYKLAVDYLVQKRQSYNDTVVSLNDLLDQELTTLQTTPSSSWTEWRQKLKRIYQLKTQNRSTFRLADCRTDEQKELITVLNTIYDDRDYVRYRKDKEVYLYCFRQIVNCYQLTDAEKQDIEQLTGINRNNVTPPPFLPVFLLCVFGGGGAGLFLFTLIWLAPASNPLLIPALTMSAVLMGLGLALSLLAMLAILLEHHTIKAPFLSEELLASPRVDENGERLFTLEIPTGDEWHQPKSNGQQLYQKASFFDKLSIWAGIKSVKTLVQKTDNEANSELSSILFREA